MADVSPDQFGKPYFTKGGQGKFFHDPKPTDEHRYPRGYTPERMDQVRQAHIRVDQFPGGDGPAFGGPAGPHRVKETLARSTIPLEHLSRAQMMGKGITHPLAIVTQAHQIKDFAHGLYSPGAKNEGGMVAIAPGGVGGAPEEKSAQSMIHEVGHFFSNKIHQNAHSRYLEHPKERGKEEAFADDFRQTHFRPDPRDVRKGVNMPVESSYEHSAETQGGSEFASAYHAARTTPNIWKDRRAAANRRSPLAPGNGRQAPLFGLTKGEIDQRLGR